MGNNGLTSKKRIVILSLLKPVDDVRGYLKMGRSLSEGGQEVHMIGVDSLVLTKDAKVTFHPLGNYDRSLGGRLRKMRQAWQILLQLQPEVLIANGIDTLPLIICSRIKFGSVCIEDVQEDMLKNVLHSAHLSSLAKLARATTVRLYRKVAKPFTQHWLLAERCYLADMKLHSTHCTFIENKALRTDLKAKSAHGNRFNLIYCGTISSIYGIWEALALARALHKVDDRYRLHIIGFAPDETLRRQLTTDIANDSFITLTTAELPLPHRQVMKAMATADVCLLSYRDNPSTSGCVPTKLYECMSLQLPMLIPHNPLWKEVAQGSVSSLIVDYEDINEHSLHALLQSSIFYSERVREDIFWDDEGKRLTELVSRFYEDLAPLEPRKQAPDQR